MNPETLKSRLLLKKLEICLMEEDEWNFGYSPSNSPHYDEVLRKRNELSGILEKTDYAWWKTYSDCRYKDNLKLMKKLNTYSMKKSTGFKDKKGKGISENDTVYLIYSNGHERDGTGDFGGNCKVKEVNGEWILFPVDEYDELIHTSLSFYANPSEYGKDKIEVFELKEN